MKKIIIAIDGPAGSGKTTTAKIVAEKLGYLYIDTGAMYRAVSLAWLKKSKEYDEIGVRRLCDEINIELKTSFKGQRTLIDGVDVSDEIRTPEVTKMVSPVSANGYVRNAMVALQRELGEKGGVVMDGRDIGTVVFPNAELKIFLVASIDARAQRRTLEMKQKGIPADEKEIKEQILYRDNYDSTRSHSPMYKADDAIEIDSSEITIEQQSEIILNYAAKIIEQD
jgi:CMP/dCMP kinase